LRNYCVSEYDYAAREPRRAIGIDQSDARMVMIFDGRWKYVHVEQMRPLLFDLLTDPNELNDLGADPTYSKELERLKALHFDWNRKHHNRITRSVGAIEKITDRGAPPGILIGYTNKTEVDKDGRIFPTHVKQ